MKNERKQKQRQVSSRETKERKNSAKESENERKRGKDEIGDYKHDPEDCTELLRSPMLRFEENTGYNITTRTKIQSHNDVTKIQQGHGATGFDQYEV